jgi:hypothetical protein
MLLPLTGRRSRSQVRRQRRFETLESRLLLSTVPYGATEQDTGEYMLGTVLTTVVLMESDGSVDPNLEDWNPLVRDNDGNVVLDEHGRTINAGPGPNLIEQAKDKIREGMAWWEDTLASFGSWLTDPTPTPVHYLDFRFDFEYAHNPVATGYEPISRPSYDYSLWVEDFLDQAGYSTYQSLDVDIRSFNDAQRREHQTDWAFTIFVVNDENDLDGKFDFNQGGFQYAFAFAGGRFFVAPAGRPASSFAHETGHMFWARDEYQGGGSYTDRRGYYNSQNLNAWDNPQPGFVQQDSMMDSGLQLEAAWDAHVSSESSLAMIGWQDSDADGVFDVLDVPLTLTGSGYWEPDTGMYHFHGHSEVQTLPNMNLSGLRNDITINEVSVAEYSTDGGESWTVAEEYHAYQAQLDLALALEPGEEIWIRTRCIDPGTGQTVVSSETVFQGSTALPTAAVQPGVQGFVWEDADADDLWDPGEVGLAGWTLQLVDDQLQPLDLRRTVEPDDYGEWQSLKSAVDGLTLSAIGGGVTDDDVGAITARPASTGQRVFGYLRWGTTSTWSSQWEGDSQLLRIDFDQPVTSVSLDAIAPNRTAYGRLEVYDAADNLLGRYTTQELDGSEVETMTLRHATPQIAYALASGTMGTAVRLDNLQVGPASAAVTDVHGAYALPGLPPGSYQVQVEPPDGWMATTPASGVQQVVVGSDGLMQWDGSAPRPSDFGGQFDASEFPWHNPRNPLDVDDDGSVIPRDALLVINELNRNGSGALPTPSAEHAPPPYYDVNADNRITPMDALLVINYLQDAPDGTGGSGGGTGAGGGGGAEGEAQRAMDLGSRPSLDNPLVPELVDTLVAPLGHRRDIAAASEPVVAGVPEPGQVPVSAASDQGTQLPIGRADSSGTERREQLAARETGTSSVRGEWDQLVDAVAEQLAGEQPWWLLLGVAEVRRKPSRTG